MTTLGLALPDPQAIELSQAAEWATKIEIWSETTEDIDALADTQLKLQAIESYLRKQNERAAAEIARADRKLEVRIGSLLERRPAHRPKAGEITPTHGSLSSQRASDFRTMAEHADDPAVAEAIEEGASRSEVLRKARAGNPIGYAKAGQLTDLVVSAPPEHRVEFRLEFRERWGCSPTDITEDVFDECVAWVTMRLAELGTMVSTKPALISSGQVQELLALVHTAPASSHRQLKDAFKRAFGAHVEKLPEAKFDAALVWMTTEAAAINSAPVDADTDGEGVGPDSLPAPSPQVPPTGTEGDDVGVPAGTASSPSEVSSPPEELVDGDDPPNSAGSSPSDQKRSGRVNPEPKTNATPYRARAVPVVEAIGATLGRFKGFASHPDGLIHGWDKAMGAATPAERDGWARMLFDLGDILDELRVVTIRPETK